MSRTSDNTSRHISWEQLQVRIKSGVPFVHRIPSCDGIAPAVEIWVSEFGEELALRIPGTKADSPKSSPLEDVNISLVHTSAGLMLEVRTRARILYQEVYSFFVSVADKIQLNGTKPIVAVEETLEGWRELMKTEATLSEEVQLGLRGELYFLRLLINKIGDQALDAWVGPQRQPHDFRIGANEFEVKATRAATHTHIINGLAQLESSPGNSLFVFSLRLAPSGLGSGTTLSEEIEITRDLLNNKRKIQLDSTLRKIFDYRSEHAVYYPIRLQLADTPWIIPVDDECPRLTSNLLFDMPQRNRIENVRYSANFEGIGFQEDSKEFSSLLDLLSPVAHII